MKYFLILSTLIAANLFASRENPETGWEYAISTQSAYYYLETLTIDGVPAVGNGGIGDYCADNLNACDVIGAFVEADDGSGEICVGWQYALETGWSEVPVMGDDGNTFTAGYAVSGEVPSFKVYDASADGMFAVYPYMVEGDLAFNTHLVVDMEKLLPEFSHFERQLDEGANLISLYVLPTDASLANVFESISDCVALVIAEGYAALNDSSGWIGSLEYIDMEPAYWVVLNFPATLSFAAAGPARAAQCAA